jgi:hypothetical protein
MGFRFSIYLKNAQIIIEIAPVTAVSIHIHTTLKKIKWHISVS